MCVHGRSSVRPTRYAMHSENTSRLSLSHTHNTITTTTTTTRPPPDYGTSSRDRFSGLSAPGTCTSPRTARSAWPPL
eukprot:scaffold50084_cov87-Phaeocystis_antarctica.AAC.3